MTTPRLPEGIEKLLTGEDGAHAIECDCDFNPDCDDSTHPGPEYHIGEACGKVQDALRREIAAVVDALNEALRHTEEHMTGCLYCGEDEEYVKEHGEVSLEHQRVCWYYKARAAIREGRDA